MTSQRFSIARWAPTSPRSMTVFAFDLAAAACAWLGAFLLRFNLAVPEDYLGLAMRSLAWVVPIYAAAFLASGLYRGLLRFASLPDLFRIARACLLGGVTVALVAYLLQLELPVPRSVIILSPLLLTMAMGGARAVYRGWREGRQAAASGPGRPLVIIGAGEAAVALIRELQRSGDWRVVGLLDEDKSKHGRELLGHPVLGSIEDLPRLYSGLGVRDAIIAMPEAAARVRQQVATACLRVGVRGMTVPALADLMDGRVTLSSVRKLNLDDLLGREPVTIDTAHVERLIANRVVLVTGAAGSIGSEICRQLARFRPAKLVFFDQNEFGLYRLVEEFGSAFPDVVFEAAIGDVKDARRVASVFRQSQPSVVFHAAAYKHVPLMEGANAWQAVLNNALGTMVLSAAAARFNVERFVLVSTDKAVNPTNVMGASKRLAEMVCQAQQLRASHTRFVVVRFGNVVGSAGSVIPKFEEQIAKGGPLTVTHPEMKRYFMSIPEASLLVLQAATMGSGGQIFVLEMGESIAIVELARNMIRLSGHAPEDIGIEFTGLRPGEKLEEELLSDRERTTATPHPKLRVAIAGEPPAALLERLSDSSEDMDRDSEQATHALLREFVPEFQPNGGDRSAQVTTHTDSPPAAFVIEGELKSAAG
jgi:FlaA1/EpsC-like NDP-sugar epimerase